MKHSKNTIFRRVIFIILTFAAFVIQFTYIPALSLSFPLYTLIPLSVSVAMFEKEFSGILFGLLAGILWDMASPMPDGILALGFCIFAFITGLLTRYLIRNTLLSALLLSFAACLIYSSAALLATGFSSDPILLREIAVSVYLPATALSSLLTLPVYFGVRKISVALRNEKSA